MTNNQKLVHGTSRALHFFIERSLAARSDFMRLNATAWQIADAPSLNNGSDYRGCTKTDLAETYAKASGSGYDTGSSAITDAVFVALAREFGLRAAPGGYPRAGRIARHMPELQAQIDEPKTTVEG